MYYMCVDLITVLQEKFQHAAEIECDGVPPHATLLPPRSPPLVSFQPTLIDTNSRAFQIDLEVIEQRYFASQIQWFIQSFQIYINAFIWFKGEEQTHTFARSWLRIRTFIYMLTTTTNMRTGTLPPVSNVMQIHAVTRKIIWKYLDYLLPFGVSSV